MGFFKRTKEIVLPIEEEEGNDKKDVNSILDQYAADKPKVTVLKDNNLVDDVIAAAHTFASMYLGSAKDLDSVKDAMKDIGNELDMLKRLDLHHTSNYEELEQKRNRMREFLKGQEVFVTREKFVGLVWEKIKDTLFVGFADFKNIMDKYSYGPPKSMKEYRGSVSTFDIQALGDLKAARGLDQYFGFWRPLWKVESLDLIGKSIELENVVPFDSRDCIALFRLTRVGDNPVEERICLVRLRYRICEGESQGDFYGRHTTYKRLPLTSADIVKNGLFEVGDDITLPESSVRIEGEIFTGAGKPLLIESPKASPIAFLPWCDGIAIFRIFSEDSFEVPSSLKKLYQCK